MNRIATRLLVSIVCLFVASAVPAQTNKRKVDFQETVLKNGLRVLIVEDRSAPVVALAITYNVGSRDERKGKTGFAHLFEHMMFQGSANVGKGEYGYQIFNNGGEMNGTTNEDHTSYFAIVPGNQLDALLFLESDRMRSLDVTQENLDNQRNAVKEERRLRVDNQPYGKADEVMQELIYDNFAYKHTTIGSMADLDSASIEDVKEFFRIYYAPNNAVLTLVGDFNARDALTRIRKHFESIPRQPDPPAVDMTEPQQQAERRTSVTDSLARLARVEIAHKAVAGNAKDYYALRILSTVLQGGQSSRLYQKLVKDRELLIGVGGTITARRGPGAFYVSATLKSGIKTEEIETAIYEEIERLKRELISNAELDKAKRIQRRGFINSTANTLSIAVGLSNYAVDYNDPQLVNTRVNNFDSVTAEDVRRVANLYLNEKNRTVVITIPAAKQSPKPQKKDGTEGSLK
jgi:zinc protease